MGFLLDTNVVSELRKIERCSRSVRNWFEATPAEELFTSVLVMGEIRRGVEICRIRDVATALVLEKWLHEVEAIYDQRILPVTGEICDIWGGLSINARLPAVDGLLAATALHHRLTLVTSNKPDVERSGVDCLNPFVEQ